MGKKDCMVQVCLRTESMFGGYGDVEIVENTDLITRKQAEALWDKWFPKVRDQLKDGAEIEMCIWINCKDNYDYHTFVGHINHNCEVDDMGRVWQVKRRLMTKDLTE